MSYRTATMCLAAILLLAGAIHPSWAATDLNSIVEFDISAGPLPGALLKYSQQSGIQVTSAADVVDRKQSPGVKGPYPAAKALTQLLLGTQLEFDTVNPSTVSIRRESRSTLRISALLISTTNRRAIPLRRYSGVTARR